jgi:hypothetical protein
MYNVGGVTSWKSPLGRLRRKWEDQIKMYVKEIDGTASGSYSLVGFCIGSDEALFFCHSVKFQLSNVSFPGLRKTFLYYNLQ